MDAADLPAGPCADGRIGEIKGGVFFDVMRGGGEKQIEILAQDNEAMTTADGEQTGL